MRTAEILEDWGYLTTTSFNASDALTKCNSGEVELVIAGADIPGFDAAAFLESLVSEHETIPVIFLTRDADVEQAVRWMKSGACDVLLKPVDFEQLKLLLQKALALNVVPVKFSNAQNESTRIVTRDTKMQRLLELIRQVADSRASVLIEGESGTGKELFARYMHDVGNRKQRPFVAVNSSALPENLLESELFGHEKGAFTGAVCRKQGKFEIANGGTLLLDEITEIPFHLQAKLLRALQEREIDRVGGQRPVKVDVRIIATTNRNIHQAIEKGEFREDLFYRLNVIPLKIPPLRERLNDIAVLAEHFVDKYNRIDGRNVKGLTPAALAILEGLPFPGNVRELENIIERALLLCGGDMIHERDLYLENLPPRFHEENPDTTTLDDVLVPGPLKEVEKKLIFHTLNKTNGNRTHAAKILGISIRTLRNKLNEYKEQVEVI